MTTSLYNRSLLSISDLTPEELAHVVDVAQKLKKDDHPPLLRGKSVALIFEKPSLRTKVSFDVAVYQLGGNSIYLGQNEIGLGQREAISDVARTLSRYTAGIVARVFSHQSLVELSRFAGVPVINALSDLEHPCQALADLLTIIEKKKSLRKLRIAFIGDGNNVAASLAFGTTMLGADLVIASPGGYELPAAVQEKAGAYAKASGGGFAQIISPEEAITGADVVYTDVWASMGQESSAESRAKAFSGYTVTLALFAHAKPNAIFMHDLPAHRGEEVVSEVIDGPQSVVFDQAENRLHAQRAILALLLSGT